MSLICPICNKKLPTKPAIIYIKEGCGYSEKACNVLNTMYGKKNVKIIPIKDGKNIKDIRSGFKNKCILKFGSYDGTTVPFIIIKNKYFIGGCDELIENQKEICSLK